MKTLQKYSKHPFVISGIKLMHFAVKNFISNGIQILCGCVRVCVCVCVLFGFVSDSNTHEYFFFHYCYNIIILFLEDTFNFPL